MNGKDKISVIIPCYNVQKYIMRCFDSIYSQTYGFENLEVILIDDLSTDNTWSILESLQRQYPENVISLKIQKKGKCGGARNLGMDICTGKYITFVDADDYVHPDMLRVLYDRMTEDDYDVAQCGVSCFKADKPNVLEVNDFEIQRLDLDNVDNRKNLIIGLTGFTNVTAWAKLYSTKFIREHNLRFIEDVYYEDTHFSMLCVLLAKKYCKVQSTLYYYFENTEGIIRSEISNAKIRDTVVTFKQAKEKGEKLTMLTAYDYSTAKLIDEAGINAILVGDSLGMVVLGYEDTLSVTMEDMIHHSAAVSRGIKDTLLITDMPFMSYQTSVYDAVVNAGRLVKEGHAQAVKLEGGKEVCPQIKAIVDASIPVCAHLGLTPQSVNAFGGFKVQGKGEEAAQKLLDEARAVEEAGAFAVVLECVPKALAKKITESISIPTIGIGAGADCDGQVLVYQDMLAMYANMKPKFVKQFAQVGKEMNEAFTAYKKAVEEGSFPGEEHTFKMDETIIDKLY